jgi:putative tryptophan/tyrosine transport system substrate-binding protein
VLAFQKGLLERGLNVGQNVRIDYRFGVASVESISTAVADILATSPEVMLAHGTAVTAALQKQTQTVPVVFTVVSDPVGSGFIQSFARPGGNFTGFTNFLEPSMAAEWVELLKEIAPGVSRLGILFNPQLAAGVGMYFARPAEAPRSELRRSDYPLKVLPHRSGYQRVRARAERWADCATGHHNSAAS